MTGDEKSGGQGAERLGKSREVGGYETGSREEGKGIVPERLGLSGLIR